MYKHHYKHIDSVHDLYIDRAINKHCKTDPSNSNVSNCNNSKQNQKQGRIRYFDQFDHFKYHNLKNTVLTLLKIIFNPHKDSLDFYRSKDFLKTMEKECALSNSDNINIDLMDNNQLRVFIMQQSNKNSEDNVSLQNVL